MRRKLTLAGWGQYRARRNHRTPATTVRVTVERLQAGTVVSKQTGTGDDLLGALHAARARAKSTFRAVSDVLTLIPAEEETVIDDRND